MGDRVGFVEPRSGYELYLLPPGTGTTKLLSEHGHPEISPEALGKDVVLVGVIVWRRSHLSSSSSHRQQPDRNNNVKRHAVASSTHHHESKSSRAGVGPSKDPSSDPRSRPRGSNSNATTNVSSAALSSMHLLKFPVESSPTKDPSPARNWPSSTSSAAATTATSNANVLKSHHILPAPSDATTDMPPGFSIRQPAQPSARPHLDPRPGPSLPPADAPPGFWPRPAPTLPARQPLSEEDDDLPEFDFSVHTVAAGPPRSPGQFNPVVGPSLNSDPPPSHLSQFQSPSRVVVPEQGNSLLPSNPGEFSSGYPPRPPGPPPPPQDPASSFLSRNNPNYYPSVAAPMSHEGDQFRSLQQEPLRVHGGALLGPQQHQQYGGSVVNNGSSIQVGAPLRNDLPEWRPSAQFQQLRPPPTLYENDPRQMVGAAAAAPPPPQHLHFDPAAAVGGAPPPPPLPVVQQQEMTWPPPQQHQQQQQPPPTLLPPPPPPQWQPQPQEQPRGHFQQPQWQHSNHFQQQAQPQQHVAPPVRSVDPRGGPFNSWEAAAAAAPPTWDAAGARNVNSNNEHHRDNRTSGDHRMQDPRSNEQWHDNRDNNRDANGGRPDFRRR